MKRFLLIFLFIALSVVMLPAATKYDFNFTLVLEKKAVDSLWMNMTSTQQTIRDATRVTSYNFGLIQAGINSTETKNLDVYLHWEKNSALSLEIRLYFVGGESDSGGSGFMMNESGSTSAGLNYNVTVSDSNKSKIGEFAFSGAEVRLKATDNRIIKFTPEDYKSPAKISITVNPASYDGTSYNEYWSVDKQYIGYIRAEMWTTS